MVVNLQIIIIHLIILNLIKKSSPFTLIHNDVWDLVGTLHQMEKYTCHIYRWSYKINMSLITWWNQNLKLRTYSYFFHMVHTKFQEMIKVFRSYNGKEYFNKHLNDCFSWKLNYSPKLLCWHSTTKWSSWKKK